MVNLSLWLWTFFQFSNSDFRASLQNMTHYLLYLHFFKQYVVCLSFFGASFMFTSQKNNNYFLTEILAWPQSCFHLNGGEKSQRKRERDYLSFKRNIFGSKNEKQFVQEREREEEESEATPWPESILILVNINRLGSVTSTHGHFTRRLLIKSHQRQNTG